MNKRPKILLINAPGLSNRGGMAVLMGAIICIQKYILGSDITIMSHHYRNDKYLLDDICTNYHVHALSHPWFKFNRKHSLAFLYNIVPAFVSLMCALYAKIASYANLKMKNIYRESDVIIDLNVDSLTEHYHGWASPFFVLFNDLIAILSNKPLIVLAASISFINNPFVRFLLREVLNKAKLITVREENSLGNLSLLKIEKPLIRLTADLSFTINKSDEKAINNLFTMNSISTTDRPLIGITITREITRKTKSPLSKMKYFELYASITDWMIEKYGATVICVPNVYQIEYFKDMETIKNIVKHKEQFHLIYDIALSDSEIRTLLSRCQLTVGSMFHPSLLAISCGVPTLVICSYGSYKVHGVIGKMMDLEKYIIDYGEGDIMHLKETIYELLDYIWDNRTTISASLHPKVSVIKERAFLNGILLKDILQQSCLIDTD